MCLIIHHSSEKGVNAIHDSTGRGKLETVQVELSWTLLLRSLPLADVNLHSFAVINKMASIIALSEFCMS